MWHRKKVIPISFPNKNRFKLVHNNKLLPVVKYSSDTYVIGRPAQDRRKAVDPDMCQLNIIDLSEILCKTLSMQKNLFKSFHIPVRRDGQWFWFTFSMLVFVHRSVSCWKYVIYLCLNGTKPQNISVWSWWKIWRVDHGFNIYSGSYLFHLKIQYLAFSRYLYPNNLNKLRIKSTPIS